MLIVGVKQLFFLNVNAAMLAVTGKIECTAFMFIYYLSVFRHYPIGLLFDLHASNTALPWSITVHFKVKLKYTFS